MYKFVKAVEAKRETERIWRGVGISSGAAQGVVLRVGREARLVKRATLTKPQIELEVARLYEAVAETRAQLLETKRRAARRFGADHAAIFEAHLAMLDDPKLIGDTLELIRHESLAADYSLKIVVDRWLAEYVKIEDDYLRQRASDVEDVAWRLQRLLARRDGAASDSRSTITDDTVIVAEDLLPSLVAELDASKVCGLVSDVGGWTTHAAIFARGLGIPAVVGAHDFYRHARTGDKILIDAEQGEVILHPSFARQQKFQQTQIAVQDLPLASHLIPREPADGQPDITLDGAEFCLRANIELPIEYQGIETYGARGIGLYRSEFLWLQHARMPSEDEQFAAYQQAVMSCAQGEAAVIRLFDLGGDKANLDARAAQEAAREHNPALGLRAIRFGLRHKAMLRAQVRACLRAAAHGNLKIVVPMVSDVSDLEHTGKIIDEETTRLKTSGVECGDVELGAMIEVPSAVWMSDSIARRAAFFNLGTNDLVQYLLAVDRSNETVASWFRTLHPAVLRAIRQTLETAARHNLETIMCGEMAATPVYAFVLIGLGARSLSMTPAAIPRVRRVLRAIDADYARDIAQVCLELDDADAVEKLIRQRLSKDLPQVFSTETLPATKPRK